MPNEKEFNGILFDQLALLERVLDALEDGGEERARKVIETEKGYILRKLYQDSGQPEQ